MIKKIFNFVKENKEDILRGWEVNHEKLGIFYFSLVLFCFKIFFKVIIIFCLIIKRNIYERRNLYL